MKALIASLFATSAILTGISAHATDAATGNRLETAALAQGTEAAADEEKKTDEEKKADNEEKKADDDKKSD